MKHNPVSICSNFKLKSQGDKVHHSTRHIAALQSSGAYHIAEIHINHGSGKTWIFNLSIYSDVGKNRPLQELTYKYMVSLFFPLKWSNEQVFVTQQELLYVFGLKIAFFVENVNLEWFHVEFLLQLLYKW